MFGQPKRLRFYGELSVERPLLHSCDGSAVKGGAYRPKVLRSNLVYIHKSYPKTLPGRTHENTIAPTLYWFEAKLPKLIAHREKSKL